MARGAACALRFRGSGFNDHWLGTVAAPMNLGWDYRGVKDYVSLRNETTTADNGAGQIPWVKTPIYLVSQEQMADFVCKHPFWLNIDEVYKNVPEKKPSCQ